MERKISADILNIIFGLIIMLGGAFILFDRINLGSLIAGMGLVFELVKLVIEKGL